MRTLIIVAALMTALMTAMPLDAQGADKIVLLEKTLSGHIERIQALKNRLNIPTPDVKIINDWGLEGLEHNIGKADEDILYMESLLGIRYEKEKQWAFVQAAQERVLILERALSRQQLRLSNLEAHARGVISYRPDQNPIQNPAVPPEGKPGFKSTAPLKAAVPIKNASPAPNAGAAVAGDLEETACVTDCGIGDSITETPEATGNLRETACADCDVGTSISETSSVPATGPKETMQ